MINIQKYHNDNYNKAEIYIRADKSTHKLLNEYHGYICIFTNKTYSIWIINVHSDNENWENVDNANKTEIKIALRYLIRHFKKLKG
jgi:hypothetical protein